MRRLVRGLVKWAFLTALAIVVGGALGSAYALTLKEPVQEAAPLEPAAEETPVEEQIGLQDRTAPPAPTLTSPEDGSLVSLRPMLTWDAVEDASNVIYGLDLSNDPGFPDEATTRVRNLAAPEWRPDTPFSPLVKVYWRVYALDAGLNEGPASDPRSFVPLFPLDAEVGAGRDITPDVRVAPPVPETP